MKRLFFTTVLVAVVCLPVSAGDILMPGSPAPCTQNCPQANQPDSDELIVNLILSAFGLLP